MELEKPKNKVSTFRDFATTMDFDSGLRIVLVLVGSVACVLGFPWPAWYFHHGVSCAKTCGPVGMTQIVDSSESRGLKVT